MKNPAFLLNSSSGSVRTVEDEPEGVAVAGQSVTLTVTNTGDQPFIYQVNGTNVGSATVTVTNR